MNKIVKLAGLGAGVLISASASASVPWLIDWAHTTPYQHFVFKLTYLTNEAGHNRTTSQPRAQLCYGVTKNLEFSARGDLLDKKTATANHQGISDTVFALKYRLFQDARDTEVGVTYTTTCPSAEATISGKAWANSPSLMVSKTFGHAGLYAQIGETFPGTKKAKNSTYYGALLTYNATPDFLLGTELYNVTATKPGAKQDHAWGLGAMYRTNPYTTYYARYGHSAEGFSDMNLTLGVQFLFGKLNKTQKQDKTFLLNRGHKG